MIFLSFAIAGPILATQEDVTINISANAKIGWDSLEMGNIDRSITIDRERDEAWTCLIHPTDLEYLPCTSKIDTSFQNCTNDLTPEPTILNDAPRFVCGAFETIDLTDDEVKAELLILETKIIENIGGVVFLRNLPSDPIVVSEGEITVTGTG